MVPRRRTVIQCVSLAVLVLVAACAAGNTEYAAQPAGFWAGLWHGIISLIALIVSFFADGVEIYERNNVGTLYDVGFMLGILIVSGGSGGRAAHQRARRRRQEEEWQEVADKVEAKVRRKLRVWAEAESDADWDDVERKVAEKLKRKLRNWAEEDEQPPR